VGFFASFYFYLSSPDSSAQQLIPQQNQKTTGAGVINNFASKIFEASKLVCLVK